MSRKSRVREPSKLFLIERNTIIDIPIAQWKLMETYEKRVKEL